MGDLKLSERAYLKLSSAVPPAVATRMDLMRPSSFASAPLNGQRERQRIVRELVAAVDFDEVVETGTFRAATTLFLSYVTGKPVYSVELLPRYFRFAQLRCADEPNIHLVQGDSRSFLRDLAPSIGGHTTLFYLDAHWQPNVPRFEELEIISATWTRAIVMVDDFSVPDDDGYGFVRYGTIPLNENYLPELRGWGRFYPTAPSSVDTGAKRGCIVLATAALIDRVAEVNSLRTKGA